MNKKIFMVLFVLANLMAAPGALAYCAGGYANFFYGDLTIDGLPADAPVDLKASIEGYESFYTTNTDGQYGNELTDDKFAVSGHPEGYIGVPTIQFYAYIDGQWVDTGETAPYVCGATDELDLSAETPTCTTGETQPCGTTDVGECEYGTQTCTDGEWGACTGSVGPTAEVCDGLDNNCDGSTDEDFPNLGDPCSAGVGECYDSGNYVCTIDGTGTECDAEAGVATAEICDGLDNDCDGTTTDDGADEAWLGAACDGADSDLCEEGTYSCTAGAQTCSDNTGDTVEVCDGLDNDCDGSVDEDLTAPLNSLQDGVCDGSAQTCSGVGGWLDDYSGITEYEEVEVTCDTLDNDCDGAADEGDVCSGDDSDGDGVPDDQDVCPGYDDNVDTDGDGTPDGCDACTDVDLDGFCAEDLDCDDGNAAINPDAEDSNCDDVDDDCDGTADDEYVSVPTECGVGECASTGSTSCVAGVVEDSCEAGDPSAEVCDGLDNDCDGTADNGLTAPLNSLQDGVCAGSVQTCTGVGGWLDDYTGIADYEETEVTCDTLDNDCDGIADEGCVADSDGDGVPDDQDVCPGYDDNVDSDSDGTPDGCDACDSDPDKVEPGVCGCGVADIDSDGDGFEDCIDVCEGYDDNLDSDDDGTPDGCDEDVDLYEFSVPIYDGWTLFALPYNPAVLGIGSSEELGQAIMDQTGLSCDVMKRLNGAVQLMESDVLGFGDPSWSLSGAEGYFIHCDGAGTYNYEGTLWG